MNIVKYVDNDAINCPKLAMQRFMPPANSQHPAQPATNLRYPKVLSEKTGLMAGS